MHITAIYDLTEDKPTVAQSLAAAMGLTVFEASSRLRAPGSGPLAVGVFAERERAVGLMERLQTAGFTSCVLTDAEIDVERRGYTVRRFTIDIGEIRCTTDRGDGIAFPFAEIGLILRGTAIVRDVATETVKTRSISPGRALLSGGLMITKTASKTSERATEERQGFAHLYAKDHPPLVLRENALVYDSLGPSLKPSRAANFRHLVAEMRRLCPNAVYNERLLTRAGQATLLGPSLMPEDSIEIAAALLRKVLLNTSRQD
jgi:hypothetical protein